MPFSWTTVSARLRHLRIECLEPRWLLSTDSPKAAVFQELTAAETAPTYMTSPIADMPISGNTGEKPQSKVWHYDDRWWSVLADSTGTWVWRLDDVSWTRVLKLSSTKFQADVKPVGGLAHILLERTSSSRLASIEYVPGSPGTYRLWSVRPATAAPSPQ